MYEHILIPLDRSEIAECAIPHGIALARVFNARLTLIHVVDDTHHDADSEAVNPLAWQMKKAEGEAYLADISDRLRNTGVEIDFRVTEGHPAQRILAFAENQGVSLIVLSSHGASGLSNWNISSIVQKVILRAFMPVMIVRAYQRVEREPFDLNYEYKHLEVLLDGSSRAECVIPIASAIASHFASTVLLAHVIKKPEMPRRLTLSDEEKDLIDKFVERNRKRGEEYLENLSNQLSFPVEKRLVITENQISALHDLEEEEDTDLVLLSAHGYSGDARRPYGSVALNFIAFGTSPLLIVQDFSREEIRPSMAEKAASEQTGH